jgi:lipoprotein NlpD
MRAAARMVLFPVAAAFMFLGGCASRQSAPVIERAPVVQVPAAPQASAAAVDQRPETYTVKRGETLYGIALDHGQDYRELAEWNGISNPNVIRAGDTLRLRAPATAAVSEGAAQVKPVTSAGAVESRPLGAGPEAASAARKPDAATVARVEPRRPEPEAKPKPEAQPPGPRPDAPSDDDEKVDWSWPVS